MERRTFLFGFAAFVWLAAAGCASAKDGDDDDDGDDDSGDDSGDDGDDDNDDDADKAEKEARDAVERAVSRGEIASVATILRIALAHTPGRALDVKLNEVTGRFIYRVRILNDAGRRRELLIDAKSRRIVGVK